MAKLLLRLLEQTGELHPCPASVVGANGVWDFPMGLQSYGEERAGRVQILHLPDGVTADNLGISPPQFKLEGTFGTKTKTIRGRTLTAQELTNDLIAFVRYYFEERRNQIRERRPLIEMAFDDFVHTRHWIVQPDGAPSQRKSAREPLRSHWSLGLQAVRRVQSAPTTRDTTRETITPASVASIAERLALVLPVP
jgi:hypothetical protein